MVYRSSITTQISGLLLLTPSVFYDVRGEFVSTFNVTEYSFLDAEDKPIEFVEDDLAISRYSVLRGLHGDQNTWKLIQCVAGEAYFVAADMRPTSPTYLKWAAFALNDVNRRQVLVPAGCCQRHAISTRNAAQLPTNGSRIYQTATSQFTVRWDEPKLGIYWPIPAPILSERDRTAPLLV